MVNNMKVVVEKNIQGKLAQLILQADGVTLEVMYDGECILLDREIWEDLKGTDLIEVYLDMTVESYLGDKVCEEEFNKALLEEGWL